MDLVDDEGKIMIHTQLSPFSMPQQSRAKAPLQFGSPFLGFEPEPVPVPVALKLSGGQLGVWDGERQVGVVPFQPTRQMNRRAVGGQARTGGGFAHFESLPEPATVSGRGTMVLGDVYPWPEKGKPKAPVPGVPVPEDSMLTLARKKLRAALQPGASNGGGNSDRPLGSGSEEHGRVVDSLIRALRRGQ